MVFPFDDGLNRSCFVFSHMTCKKCKYEFCWVCMGTIFRSECFRKVAHAWCPAFRSLVGTWNGVVFL